MLFVYPAIFHKENGSYWVEFPDLQGCQTYGNTINETINYAQEALESYISSMLEQNLTLPVPSDITLIKVDDGFTSLVSCNINQYKATKAVKKTLTIPMWLNEQANDLGLNFSQVLQDALLTKIQAK
ncbi:type II toxin-antitoxin system HicB family antitoxin [bacterium]|nr:type II toxin-antitoxin system HicB family antitoxin [bacterium]